MSPSNPLLPSGLNTIAAASNVSLTMFIDLEPVPEEGFTGGTRESTFVKVKANSGSKWDVEPVKTSSATNEVTLKEDRNSDFLNNELMGISGLDPHPDTWFLIGTSSPDIFQIGHPNGQVITQSPNGGPNLTLDSPDSNNELQRWLISV